MIGLPISIVAISAIALLRAFMRLNEGDPIPDRTLAWLVGLHLMFVVSGVLLALKSGELAAVTTSATSCTVRRVVTTAGGGPRR